MSVYDIRRGEAGKWRVYRLRWWHRFMPRSWRSGYSRSRYIPVVAGRPINVERLLRQIGNPLKDET